MKGETIDYNDAKFYDAIVLAKNADASANDATSKVSGLQSVETTSDPSIAASITSAVTKIDTELQVDCHFLYSWVVQEKVKILR